MRELTPAVAGVTVSAPRANSQVLLALPWLKHTNPLTAICVAMLRDRRTPIVMNFGDAFVAHSRNKCADAFLRTSCEWMLSIDDDMVVPFGDAEWFRKHGGFPDLPEPFVSFHAIDRLVSSGRTLIGGLYFGRNPNGRKMYGDGTGGRPLLPRNEVRPVKWVATGCLLTHRSVFLDIEKKFPNLARRGDGSGGNWYTSSEHDIVGDLVLLERRMAEAGPDERGAIAQQAVSALSHKIKTNSTLGMGEDVIFCKRAAQAGHTPHVDLGLICGHVGSAIYNHGNTKEA